MDKFQSQKIIVAYFQEQLRPDDGKTCTFFNKSMLLDTKLRTVGLKISVNKMCKLECETGGGMTNLSYRRVQVLRRLYIAGKPQHHKLAVFSFQAFVFQASLFRAASGALLCLKCFCMSSNTSRNTEVAYVI